MSEDTPADRPDIEITRDSYDEVAQRYAEMFATELDRNPFDRAMLGVFAELIRADGNRPVLDAGCGPGRIAGHLAGLGLRVTGLDVSAEMIRLARVAHPGLTFDTGVIERLDRADAELGGIVAWYSIIHTPPEQLPAVFTEFARVLAPGGRLLLGFQTAAEPNSMQPYDHRVAPGYRWSPRRLSELLTAAGFDPMATLDRPAEPTERCGQGALMATRSAASAS